MSSPGTSPSAVSDTRLVRRTSAKGVFCGLAPKCERVTGRGAKTTHARITGAVTTRILCFTPCTKSPPGTPSCNRSATRLSEHLRHVHWRICCSHKVQMPGNPGNLRSRLAQLGRDWSEARRQYPRAIPTVLATFALAVVLSVTAGVWFIASLVTGLPERGAIRRIGDMDQATAVYDATDQLVFTVYKEQRIEVPLSEISPNLIHAILDIEDQRFYNHRGIDAIRIVSAALANVRHGRRAQGGSTITQQLARQSFLRPDKTVRRKLQEAILAGRIERMYDKPHILEMYLNKVYFGDGRYGVEAASRGYFSKHASELAVPEAALLAGLVKSPSTYAPTVSKERAISRRNVVLQSMLEAGHIDRAALQAARTSKVVLHDGLRAVEPHGQYFKEQVRRELVDRFGWQRVYQGGLRVFSTIDMRMQIAAETAIGDNLTAAEEERKAVAARRARASGARMPAVS